jgi:hypothetical protein
VDDKSVEAATGGQVQQGAGGVLEAQRSTTGVLGKERRTAAILREVLS